MTKSGLRSFLSRSVVRSLFAAIGIATFSGQSFALPSGSTSGYVPESPAQAAGAIANPPVVGIVAPQWITEATYGSWEVRCHSTQVGGTKTCSAVLQVIDQKTRQLLLAWVIGRDDKGNLASIFQTPTAVVLQPGLQVQLGKGTTRQINYVNCVPQGCTASAVMDDTFTTEAEAASNDRATVTIVSVNGQSIQFGIPMAGIDRAIDSIR